jgi:hypothetical protein
MTIEQIGILLSLLLTILGWSVTAYYQKQILEKQLKAEKEKQTHQFAHEKEMLELQFQQREKELEQQGSRQQKLEVLPTARDKMIDAYSRIMYLLRRLLTHTDFNSLTESQLQDAVSKLEFSGSQKEALLHASDKTAYFLEIESWYDLDRAEKSQNDFHNYLVYKKIFIDDDLFAELNAIDNLFTKSLIGMKIAKQMRDNQTFFAAGDELGAKAPAMIEKIEKLIQERLTT